MEPKSPWNRTFAAFLFDMDGTLLDSIAVANRIWTRWAESKGVPVQALLGQIHGVRAVETIRRLNLPGVDAEREGAAVNQAEADDVAGVVEIAGAGAFLRALPPERWALVTSATPALAAARMAAAGLPRPRVTITADDVALGKPAPDCFLLAARSLGVDAGECLAWEDTAPGIAAAEAAGAAVVVVGATHARPLETHHPLVRDYVGLAVTVDDRGALRLGRRQ